MKNFFELIRYSLCGLITTGVNLVLFFLFTQMGMQYLVGNTIAYILAVFLNYWLNCRFVFLQAQPKNAAKGQKRLIDFIIVRLLSLCVDNALFYMFVSLLKTPLYLTRILLSGGIILATYVVNRAFVFKREDDGSK